MIKRKKRKKRKRILVLYWSIFRNDRKTINDHLYSFRNYDLENEYVYFNALWGLPFYLPFIKFDLVIMHYSLLSLKWSKKHWDFYEPRFVKVLKKMLDVKKVAFPQDEYYNSSGLCNFFKECGVDTVFTCALPEDFRKFYPEKSSGVRWIYPTLTGFVDEKTLQLIYSGNLFKGNKDREIDVGYRARQLPFWLGKHGQLKVQLADVFQKKLEKIPDLSKTFLLTLLMYLKAKTGFAFFAVAEWS